MDPQISSKPLEIDDCRTLILAVIERAMRDFASLEESDKPIDRGDFDTATAFLFNDNYTIDWGGEDKTLEDLLDIKDIDVEFIRRRALQMREKQREKKAYVQRSNAGPPL